MPSNRRIRVVTLLVVLAVIVTLYVTSAARQSQSNPFYVKTADALAAARAAKEASLGNRDPGAVGTGDNSVAARLKEAEEAAKKAADKKAEDFHGEQIVDTKKKEAEVLDVKKKTQDDIKEKANQAKDAIAGGAAAVKEAVLKEDKKEESPEDAEKRKVKDELNSILKRSPIIIFSKSYCRFSKKAKHIILDLYNITPAPYVVELDLDPLGAQIQAELAERTGRRTVPNVLINGKSIGGGDDVEGLHLDNKLIETIKNLGGKRMEVTKKSQ